MKPDLPSPRERLDRSRHAAPQVFERLRDAIITFDLVPGTVLSRIEIAERFGISQTPVRDALIRLGEEGLVDIFPQHATVVSRIDVASATQAHFLRKSIELEIVATLAAKADPALLERLKAAIAKQVQLQRAEDYHEFDLADQAFHRLLYEAAGVPELWTLVRRASAQIDRLRNLHLPVRGKTRAVVEDHKAIVAGIASGDPAQATAALRQHLSTTLGFVEQIRREHPEYVT